MRLMAMGKRKSEQTALWVSTTGLPVSPGHPFYAKLNIFLDEAGFDRFAEAEGQQFYAPVMGRPSLPPGRYFRLLLVGYFEGLDSEIRVGAGAPRGGRLAEGLHGGDRRNHAGGQCRHAEHRPPATERDVPRIPHAVGDGVRDQDAWAAHDRASAPLLLRSRQPRSHAAWATTWR
jgi:plasmid stabilization system protein ParE